MRDRLLDLLGAAAGIWAAIALVLAVLLALVITIVVFIVLGLFASSAAAQPVAARGNHHEALYHPALTTSPRPGRGQAGPGE